VKGEEEKEGCEKEEKNESEKRKRRSLASIVKRHCGLIREKEAFRDLNEMKQNCVRVYA
jgi:hypothetical protein